MKHHVVEIIDHLIEVVELLQVLSLGFQLLPEALILILLILDVPALLIEGIPVLR
jgi:hypothetical protein